MTNPNSRPQLSDDQLLRFISRVYLVPGGRGRLPYFSWPLAWGEADPRDAQIADALIGSGGRIHDGRYIYLKGLARQRPFLASAKAAATDAFHAGGKRGKVGERALARITRWRKLWADEITAAQFSTMDGRQSRKRPQQPLPTWDEHLSETLPTGS